MFKSIQSMGTKPIEKRVEVFKTVSYINILENEFSKLQNVNVISLDLLNNNKSIQDVSPVLEGINLFKIHNFNSIPPKKENNIYGNPVMIGPFNVFHLDSNNDSKETIFNLQFKTSDKQQLQMTQYFRDFGTSLVKLSNLRKNGIHLKDTEITQKTEVNIETTEKLSVDQQSIVILENIKGDVPIQISTTDPITIVSINSNIKVIVTYKNRNYLKYTVKQIENFTNTDSLTNINLISIFIIFILGSVILYLINVKNCRLIN